LSCYPCVGAAIDQANFFTIDEKRGGEIAHNRKIDKICIFIGTLVCLATFAVGAYTWLQSSIAEQKAYDENVRLTKRVQELRDLGVEIAYNNYITAISYNEEVAKLYDETRSGNEDMTVFLAELEGVLPKTARVTSMTLMPKTATVSFSCEDKFVAAGVLHLLRNMDTIHKMECSNVAEIAKTGEIVFTASFSLKSTAEREEEKGETEEETPGEEETPSVQDKLMVETVVPNTTDDISSITIGAFSSTLNAMTSNDLNSVGFNITEEIFSTHNNALSIGGFVYKNANDVQIDIVDGGEGMIDGLCAHTTDVVFYKGISVGITMGDALFLIGNDELFEVDGYIIVKSEAHSLVLQADAEGVFIDAIYLIDNTIFDEPEGEIMKPDDTDTPGLEQEPGLNQDPDFEDLSPEF
jgi:hypothetical protein